MEGSLHPLELDFDEAAMADDCSHDQPKSPDEDAKIAAQALEQGDLGHALFHISWALHAQPTNPGFLELFHLILDSSDDPLVLTSLEGQEVSIAHAGVHAHVLFREGMPSEAVALMAQIVGTGEGFRYLDWIAQWFSSDGMLEQVELPPMLHLISSLASCVPGNRIEDQAIASSVTNVSPIFEKFARAHDDALLKSITANILRKVDMFEPALELAIEGFEGTSTGMTASIVAMVYSSMGEDEESIQYYERAVELDPEFTGAMLDIGDRRTAMHRPEEAIRWYMKALEVDPENAWAQTHILLNRYLLEPDSSGETILDLLELAERGYPTAGDAYRRLGDLTDNYTAHIPAPSDAGVNVLHKLVMEYSEAEEYPEEISYSSTSLEAPSILSCFWAHLGVIPTISTQVPEPDPRVPRIENPRFLLWGYEGVAAMPALGPASEKVTELVSTLAGSIYFLPLWRERARSFEFAPSHDLAEDILGMMVHPSPPPEGIPMWVWLPLLQVAAATCISVFDEPEWEGSARRDALLDVLRGPMDWSVSAAAVVLGEVAQEFQPEDAPRQEILAELLATHANAPTTGYTCYMDALLATLLRFPEITEEQRAQFQQEREYYRR